MKTRLRFVRQVAGIALGMTALGAPSTAAASPARADSLGIRDLLDVCPTPSAASGRP